MRATTFILILVSAGCVDRINFDLGPASSPLVVNGYITDEPGPYTVEVSRAIESDDRQSVKNRISVKRIILLDNQGFSEQLMEISTGIYQTSPQGIRGKVGNAYSLKIEFLDGSTFESYPDTLYPGGNLENVYFNFKEEIIESGSKYGFDIYFDATSGNSGNDRFLWKLISTYQIETNPELHTRPSGEARVPDPRPCSGFVVSTDGTLQQTGPCECCTCWISQVNALPVVSDNYLVEDGKFKSIKIGYIPVDSWVFQNKISARVRQQSLSQNAYTFWKSVIAQKEAASSLFQPITGRIPTNFIQTGGEPGLIEGLFYASGVSYKSIFIGRDDIPNQQLLVEPPVFAESCLQFSNNSTNQRPSFWE